MEQNSQAKRPAKSVPRDFLHSLPSASNVYYSNNIPVQCSKTITPGRARIVDRYYSLESVREYVLEGDLYSDWDCYLADNSSDLFS
jgi:hypothetical protein